ncbi:MAG: hypothetical protein JRN45_00405 [Nitrososphaerota archaeon]|nr:hypothetical protein [Nitrososphaerota archaeon]
MDAQPGSAENLRRKLGCAVRHIHANVGAFTPDELEATVKERLIDAAAVPTELRTDYVRCRLGLTK